MIGKSGELLETPEALHATTQLETVIVKAKKCSDWAISSRAYYVSRKRGPGSGKVQRLDGEENNNPSKSARRESDDIVWPSVKAEEGRIKSLSITQATIYRISPTATPVLNMAAKAKASNTLHEWQVQDLAAAAANAQVEGDNASAKTVTPTVRLNNRTQISTKTVIVSGTQQAMNPAGHKDELAYQLSLASLELKRDIEYGLCRNDVLATSPRSSRGLVGWVVDNVNRNAGTLASYTGNTGRTKGTARALTETMLKDVLQQVFTAGGEPDVVMMGPAEKQTFSSFSGNSTRFDKGEDQKLYASIDVYVSDFGELKAVPNRFQDPDDLFVLQMDKIAVAYLRPFQTVELAKTGDAEQRELIVEYCLEMRAPKSAGAVYDIL